MSKKDEKRQTPCEVYLDSVIRDTMLKNPKLGKVIKKWRALILNTAYRVSIFKEESAEDSLGDLLIPLVQLDSTYEEPHYRYKRKIYEIEYDDSACLFLKTPQYSKLKKIRFVTMRDNVDKVKKASLSSLAYHKIQQTGSILLRNHFTQKNGYFVIGNATGIVKNRKNEYGKSFKVMNKKKLRKTEDLRLDKSLEDSTTDFYDIIASSHDQETVTDFSRMMSQVYEQCSEPAKDVLSCLLKDPFMAQVKIKKITGHSIRKVKLSKREIRIILDKVLDKKVKSIYSPYLIYEGSYFFRGEERGDLIGLKDAEDHMIFVNKAEVVYDQLAYRTPVHLRADMVCA